MFHDKKGFSIIEAIIYSAMLAVLILILSRLTLSAITSYRTARIKEDLIISSGRVLENFLRESRNASKIYLPTTVLGNDLGELSLATSFQSLNKTEPETYTDIYLVGGQIWLKRENESPQPLTGVGLEVTQFKLLRSVTTNNLEGLRLYLDLRSRVNSSETLFFSTFALLRGGYAQ
ncbi:MAG: type II secretion system protein [Patescibacteria group bacterium]